MHLPKASFRIPFHFALFQMTLALAKSLNLEWQLGLGLLYVSCVPGGGMGHIMVSIMQADHSLSVVINCATSIVAIGESGVLIHYSTCTG